MKQRDLLRDARPASRRIAEALLAPKPVASAAMIAAGLMFLDPDYALWSELIFLILLLFVRWAYTRSFELPFKFPQYAKLPDPHNPVPGKAGAGKSEGILYLGNLGEKEDPRFGQELWLTNNDARTHILYLGTTGSGKTEGLKSIVANALTWGSGFVYVDGKADTDLWASLYSLARRFGRDDDLLILNYMTANSNDGSVSNSMNPFSNGSASYLANMLVSLMPDAGGDNAMWKERAVSLMFALMPALTWKRDKQSVLLDVGVVRESLDLKSIIRLSRDPNMPERVSRSLVGYLNTLPGFVDAAFDDEGNERPPSPDQPMYDLQVARQQHGYLSMQFTRALQSLADEYGYIFKVQLADIEMLDVVLNRRILVALIPALEKSGDEAANLGKIIVANLKGMMGATLGNTVEGNWETAIGSKQTRAPSSFMAIFDEVGYYTAPGMAVMAAQARSLGFALIFAAQDIPSMEKRVKQEAHSILANCSLKIFGKIEDPLETKKFLVEHTPTSWVLESNGMSAPTSTVSSMFMTMPFYDNRGTAATNKRNMVTYDHLRAQSEGQAHMFFKEYVLSARVFFAAPDKVKSLRVHRFLPVPGSTTSVANRERAIGDITARFKDPEWTVGTVQGTPTPSPDIADLVKQHEVAVKAALGSREIAATTLAGLAKIPVKDRAGAASPFAKDKGPSVAKDSKASAQTKGLPVMQQDDEYAFETLERNPAATSKAVARGTSSMGRDNVFARTDIDTSIVTRPGAEVPLDDITQITLPENIALLLEESARKLNEGLGGRA